MARADRSAVVWRHRVLLLVLGGAIVGKLAERSQHELFKVSRHVAHAMEVEKQTDALVTSVLDAEVAVRAYVISGRREDAEPFSATLSAWPERLRVLRELIYDDVAQRGHLDQFSTLANECLHLLGRTIVVRDGGDADAAGALLLAGHVPRLLHALRAASTLIVLEEQRVLATRQQELAREAALGRASLIFVVVVTIAFVALVWTVAYRLGKLRRLARMCAWSRKIEYEGEWLTVEEYLSRRYNTDVTHGISPAEADKMRATFKSG